MKEGDIIEALDDFPLHLVDCRCAPCYTETELGSTPILFNEIEFTMVLGIKIAEMPAILDQLLKLGLLRHEIGL